METQDPLVGCSNSGDSPQLNPQFPVMQADVDNGGPAASAELHKPSLPLLSESLASTAATFDDDVQPSDNECAVKSDAFLHTNAPNGENTNFVHDLAQTTVTASSSETGVYLSAQSESDFDDKMWSCADEGTSVPSDMDSVVRSGSIEENTRKNESESENVDFGMSLAMDDFGGEFDEADEAIDDTAPPAVGTVGSELTEDIGPPAERVYTKKVSKKRQLPVSDDEDQSAVVESENNGTTELDDAADERTAAADEAGSTEKTSAGTPMRKRQRRQSDDKQGAKEKESTVELNINSRPRRSVIRKSVFELLQVDYRGSGGSRKHSIEGDGDAEAASKKKKTPAKSSDKAKRQSASHVENVVERESSANGSPTKRRVGYTPDDFMSDENGANADRQKVDDDAPPVLQALNENGSNSKYVKLNLASLASETAVQNSFAAEFEQASAEALSSLRSSEVVPKSEVDDLVTENRQLRARLKALEESTSTVKKFQIDLHGRKFSRIRSPNAGSGMKLERKIFNKSADHGQHGVYSFSETKRECDALKSNDVTGEAWKSRTALLDRREHKLRELSVELDDQSTALQVRESTLQRRERKLLELEKTLEYRERVLSRHELNIQKRELQLELVAGSSSKGNKDDSGEPLAEEAPPSNGDHSTFIAEYVRRLELRRQELERRQNFLQSEREKLTALEKSLESRERAVAAKVDEHSEPTDDSSSEEEEEEEEEEENEEDEEEEEEDEEDETPLASIGAVGKAKSAKKGNAKNTKKLGNTSPVSKALVNKAKLTVQKRATKATPSGKKNVKDIKTVASVTQSAGKLATQKSGRKVVTRLRKRSL